jgi:parallel beta-helix repeat protein
VPRRIPTSPDRRVAADVLDRARGLLVVLVITAAAASGSGLWGWSTAAKSTEASSAAAASPEPGGGGRSPLVTPERSGPSGAQPSPAPSQAAEGVYVAIDGSDAADGTAADPWRTVQHAVDRAPGGATITIGPGVFDGFIVSRSGLTVRGTPAATVVTGTGDIVVFNGVDSGLISDVEVRGAATPFGAGIRVDASSGVVVERSRLHDNRSFGIKVADSTHVTIRDNDIYGNETGIELARAGDGIVVEGNRIHDNDRMVTSARGGNAIVFYLTTGEISVTNNTIWANRAPTDAEPGYDGGAFEVYGASNLRISDNVLWDNNNAMETGTDGSLPCSGNMFTHNIVRGLGTVPGETEGMILRCADTMLVAHNTFDGLDTYAFYVTASGLFSGSITDLRIVNNIVIRGRAHSLAAGLPGGLVIDHNVVHPGGSTAIYGRQVAFVEGLGTTDSLDVFRSWTGYEAHGLQADPGFVGSSSGDYRLGPGSPVIDRGLSYGQDYEGGAPDPGRYEYTSQP